MTILLSVRGFDPEAWRAALARAAPERRVVLEPNGAGDPAVRYALVWHSPTKSLAALPNLRAVFSLGAGVDHALADAGLPGHVPLVRIVDADLSARMSEYVVWRVLDHFRGGRALRAAQAGRRWAHHPQPAARDVCVGVMGFGVLGRDAATKLRALGFRVSGWSRRAQTAEGVACFAGTDGLGPFLEHVDILVCLLPLTPDTRGILSAPLFERLKRDTPMGGAPMLVNAGRGGLQRERDILAALDAGRLSEVSLDVFEREPLPDTSPLWDDPRVFVSPHAAALSDPDALAPGIVWQIARIERGETPDGAVDRAAGY